MCLLMAGGLELDGLQGPLQPKPFCEPMIQRLGVDAGSLLVGKSCLWWDARYHYGPLCFVNQASDQSCYWLAHPRRISVSVLKMSLS